MLVKGLLVFAAVAATVEDDVRGCWGVSCQSRKHSLPTWRGIANHDAFWRQATPPSLAAPAQAGRSCTKPPVFALALSTPL